MGFHNGGAQKVSQKTIPPCFGVVRVKMCGKSTHVYDVNHVWDKPCELKCHVYFTALPKEGKPVARRTTMSGEGGRQIEPIGDGRSR